MPLIQQITPEVLSWIVAQARAGHSRDAVLHAMRESGWEGAIARAAISRAMNGEVPADPAPSVERALPWPNLTGSPCTLRALDREVQVLSVLRLPRLVTFGGLLSRDECDLLIETARPRLEPSSTVDNWDGGSQKSDFRTSQGMFFERGECEIVGRLESRVSDLLQWPVDHGEGLQVLRYGPGEEFRPHHDFFEPGLPSSPRLLERGGQRVATLLIYLKAPRSGGQTEFPDIGLEVVPVQGNAVLFSYDRPDSGTKTLHGGKPVVEGEKWVATKWLRERAFA